MDRGGDGSSFSHFVTNIRYEQDKKKRKIYAKLAAGIGNEHNNHKTIKIENSQDNDETYQNHEEMQSIL
jgi:hypothetical protein